jgi:hypothetical protein
MIFFSAAKPADKHCLPHYTDSSLKLGVSFMSDTFSVDRVAPESFFQEKYQLSLSPDPQYVHNALPERRIQWLKDEGIFSTWAVDSAVQITAPSHAFREHQTSLWQKIYHMNNSFSKLALLMGVGFAMVEAGLKLQSRLTPAGALITIGVTLLTTAVVAGFFSLRAHHAAEQANHWNRSPIQELANQRAEAYQQGFPYVYNHHLKLEKEGSSHGGLHPLEVKAMYEKYFPAFCKNLLSQEAHDDAGRERWMRDFLNMNPLSSNLMKYGLGNIPDPMKVVVDNYTHNFSLSIEPLTHLLGDLKKQVRKDTDKLVAAYEEQKKISHLSRPPIYQNFDQKIAEVKQGRNESLKSLNRHEVTQLLNYYSAARELLSRAESAWNRGGF